ncbi:MAG: hypothetical protein COB59_06610 [Rhodospirillaceae bacterium]|nr:MAG: hypothetical protein COB59_06610 [Rhodospirillaceae bacterium]
MKKIILVAHGAGESGDFSIPKVKTITKAHESLSFEAAKLYMDTKKAAPEFSSTNFDDFGGLSDQDCNALFGKVPKGTEIVFTGLHKGGDLGGVRIYALRSDDLTKDQLTDYITDNEITSMVLLACRAG